LSVPEFEDAIAQRQYDRTTLTQCLERFLVPAVHTPAQAGDDIPDIDGSLGHDAVPEFLEPGDHPPEDCLHGRRGRHGVLANLATDILVKRVIFDQVKMRLNDLCLGPCRTGLQRGNHPAQFLGQTVDMLLQAIQLLLDPGRASLIGSQQGEIALQERQSPPCRPGRKHLTGQASQT
jgi:hypothetical protein